MREGDRVIVQDHSEAHGDHGTVWHIQDNGIIVVELDSGCLWPILVGEELAPEEPVQSERAGGQ